MCLQFKFKYKLIILIIDFSRNTFILYGRTSLLFTMEINIDKIVNKKMDSTESKNLISFSIDLENLNLPKISEDTFKIYIVKMLNSTQDYLILGTNKGVIILNYNAQIRPNLISCNKLIELGDSSLYFYKVDNNSLIQIQNSQQLQDNKV